MLKINIGFEDKIKLLFKIIPIKEQLTMELLFKPLRNEI
jgi:hypothetical protein